jgi:hypothetical protein
MCTMEGTLHRRSFRARRSQATSSLCLAAVAATRPPCAAGPTTGEGSYAVRPANRRALLLPGGGLLVRPRARLLLRGLFWGGTSVQKVPAGRHGGGRPARQLRRISPGGGARRAGGAGRGGGKGKGERMGCGAAAQSHVRRKHEEVTAPAADARRPQGGGFGRDPRPLQRPVRPPCGVFRGRRVPPLPEGGRGTGARDPAQERRAHAAAGGAAVARGRPLKRRGRGLGGVGSWPAASGLGTTD